MIAAGDLALYKRERPKENRFDLLPACVMSVDREAQKAWICYRLRNWHIKFDNVTLSSLEFQAGGVLSGNPS